MEKFLLNFKKIFINLQLVFLRTKLNFKAKKLGNLVMSFVVVFGILIIVGGKFVGVGNAAQQNIEGSNMANLWNSDPHGCYQKTATLSTLRKNYPNDELLAKASFVTPDKTESEKAFQGSSGNMLSWGVNIIWDCLIVDANGNPLGRIPSGTMSSISNYTAFMYRNNSADAAYDIQQTIASINPIQQVSAQSTVAPSGVDTLQIIRSVWESVRNITFLFYIAILFIISFAIMFRQKIGGQTYVNIINSIPSLIVSLILVVFSYSISGLIISIGNWSMGLIYNIVYTQIDFYYATTNNGPLVAKKLSQIKYDIAHTAPDPRNKIAGDRNDLFLDNGIQLNYILMPFNNTALGVFDVFGRAGINSTLKSATSAIQPNFASFNSSLQQAIDTLTAAYNFAGGGRKTTDALIYIIMSIAAFFTAVKLFFALLKEYIMMMVMPIVSPIYFAASALPGKNKFIQKWLKSMFGSVFTFVAIYVAFILMIILGKGVVLSIAPGTSTGISEPLFLNLNTPMTPEILVAFISYGIFILSPQIPKIVKDAIGAASDFDKYTSAIGNETKAAAKRIPGINMIPGI